MEYENRMIRPKNFSRLRRRLALRHARRAIRMCERMGDDVAACHLQLGADLMNGSDAVAKH